MELIYTWIEKFRNYNEAELNFSEKFIIKYDRYNENIKITPNKSYSTIYPEYITNINAIVGKNSVGKTNLLDVIGLRADDRNKHSAEFEVIYNKEKGPYRIPHDVKAEIKHSKYFFIYYMGKDNNDQDLFCFEGNDIESFQSILKYKSGLSLGYWKSKYWFGFICNYSEGKLIHKYDLNTHLGEFKREIHEDGIRYYGDYKTEKEKLVIVSLRENLSNKYYNYNSTKPEDDYKISVPRRNANFQSKFLEMKVKMLYKQLQIPKRLMFQDSKYTLKFEYNSFFLENSFDDENKLLMSSSYSELDGREKKVCRVLESFVHFYFNQINDKLSNVIREKIKGKILNINVKRKSLKGYVNYYFDIIKVISDYFFNDNDGTNHVLKCYSELAEELSKNKSINFHEKYISMDITKKARINEIIKITEVTVDEKINSNLIEMFTVFGDFFDYSIDNLSDGESAYLGFFASLYEQVSMLTPSKEKYILLLDEPEERMHPELARNFVNELIRFLGDLSEGGKMFQIIISTHSPFILSDIHSSNIIYLEKDNTGYSKAILRKVNTFGANIHTLLKDGFFMSSTMGEFASKKIKEVISFITESNIYDVTEEQKKECLNIINSIGEPLIQNRIMKMFNDKFLLNYTDLYYENLKLKGKIKTYEESRNISQTIEVLKKQIENLQIHVVELEAKHNDKN
ncbi:AAA family ATPase [Rummeliibacillus pycnus]|uniref:AAA family ATPase n=1 Tax=Rummeliibacillus pycnus TaxID=101070 RepID=UPI000C9BDC92|nr:AAA family ATPase [Rummeliibacillus pycnus]